LQKEEIILDEDQQESDSLNPVSAEPYYLQLWEIERKRKDGSWSDELAETVYKDLQELHQKQLDKYGKEELTPQEAFTRILKNRKGSHHQRGMGIISFTASQVQVVDEADIEAQIDAKVNRHVSEQLRRIHETYDSRLRALEERLHPATSAHVSI